MTEVTNEFGVNIWWHIPTFTINGDRAQGLIEQAGFEPEDLPLPSRKLAVSRTAHSFQDRRHKDGRRVTEKTKDSSEYVVYGILGKTQKGEEEVGYDQATTIKLNKESGSVTAEGRLGNEFLARLSRYENSITNEDVATFLRKVVKLTYGVPLRPTGGIYFVPNRFVSLIEDAQNFLDSLGIGAKLYVQRIVDGDNEREIVWNSVENNIASQIESTLEAVDKIEKRVSSIANHETKLSELEDLMTIYQDLLGKEAEYEEITEQLQDASNTVAAKLTELQSQTVTNHNAIVPEVEKVLKQAGKALGFREIAQELKNNGVQLNSTKSRDEAEWVSLEIARSLRKGYTGIKRAGRGKYEIA
jgi:outer membrane lipopolysaccharide assembly protein LptE/RlpB